MAFSLPFCDLMGTRTWRRSGSSRAVSKGVLSCAYVTDADKGVLALLIGEGALGLESVL